VRVIPAHDRGPGHVAVIGLVFELETGVTASFCAGPVLFLALEWNSYEVYLAEMTEMLKG
jgi:hypothetical protein